MANVQGQLISYSQGYVLHGGLKSDYHDNNYVFSRNETFIPSLECDSYYYSSTPIFAELVLSFYALLQNSVFYNDSAGFIDLLGSFFYSFSCPTYVSILFLFLQWQNVSIYQKYDDSITRFFGKGFKQDKNNIYIQKAALPDLALKDNNTSESLFIALILRVFIYESNSLISKVYISSFKVERQIKNNEGFLIFYFTVCFYLLLIKEGYEFKNYNLPNTPDTYK